MYLPNHRYPLKAQTITRVMVSEIRLPIPVAVIIAPVYALYGAKIVERETGPPCVRQPRHYRS